MKEYLQAKGLNIRWETIRSALWKLDPEGIILRSVNSNIIHRRKYSVPGTLFLYGILLVIINDGDLLFIVG